MSSDVQNIFTGTIANDGTGDAIRTAFTTVNSNFANIDTRISLGNYGVVYSGTNIQANLLLKSLGPTQTDTLEVYSTANIAGNTRINNLNVNNAFVASTVTSTGNTFVQGGLVVTQTGQFASNVVIQGNLIVLGNTTSVGSNDLTVNDSLINLHTDPGLTPLTFDDGKDIGLVFHYYKGGDGQAFLGWANDSGTLEYYASGDESPSHTFTGTYGTIKAGQFTSANTTQSTSTTTGAIVTSGGLGVAANAYIGGNVVVSGNTYLQSANLKQLSVSGTVVGSLFFTGTDTIYINGSQVATSAATFTGGSVPGYTVFGRDGANNVDTATVLETRGNIYANGKTNSTSVSTGAVVVNGGVGVSGNIYAGALYGPIGGTSNSSGTFSSIVSAGTVVSLGNIVAYSGVDATTATTGALVVKGGLGVTGNVIIGGSINNTSVGVYGAATGAFTTLTATTLSTTQTIKASGNIVAGSGTATTNTTTGALVVDGGAGISGDINLGGVLNGNANSNYLVATNFSTANAQITGGSISGAHNGNAAFTTATATNLSSGNARITGGSITGGTGAFTTLTATNFSTANAQITGGSLTSVTGSASTLTATNFSTANAQITGGSITGSTGAFTTLTATNLSSGNLQVSGAITPNANASINLGSTTAWWNNIYGVSVQAKYADLAELYLADQDYEVGTVLMVGGEAEVTACQFGYRAVGVVSENPSYLMNSGLEGGTKVALKGRVPVKVIGAVKKGQELIASDNGCAIAGIHHSHKVFGIALESSSDTGVKFIEAIIL